MENAVNEISDAQLLGLYGDGDENAFHELVGRYKNSLYAFLKQVGRQHTGKNQGSDNHDKNRFYHFPPKVRRLSFHLR